tara:strand:+ start:590 stop:1336 length:747 start_codon:yes stop_codon:yes gene_type:complete
MEGVFLNGKVKTDTKLYRIIPTERLFSILENKRDALVRPKKWDDPFENLALNSPILINGQRIKLGVADDMYCQCWTRQNASDAMWRIYSNKNDGIRIRSTAGKLLGNLAASKRAKISNCFIGQVRYLNENKLKDFANTHFKDGDFKDGNVTNGNQIARTLLIKRRAFIHEKEVRLIYWSQSKEQVDNDLLFYDFDPFEIVDQIMLHPLLNNKEADDLKQKLREKGWTGELKHSKMYRPPRDFVFKVGR